MFVESKMKYVAHVPNHNTTIHQVLVQDLVLILLKK